MIIHNQHQSQDWFGACWFDMLPGADPDVVKHLSVQQLNTQKVSKITSDYCSNAEYETLDVNGGQLTDG